MTKETKAKIDRFLGRFISKKLTVFIIASIFIGLSYIDSEAWVKIAMVYIGTQAGIDGIKVFKDSYEG